MDEIAAQIFQIGFFAAVLRIATPLILATIGEMFAERAGVLGISVDDDQLQILLHHQPQIEPRLVVEMLAR